MELLRYICFYLVFLIVHGDSQVSSQIEELSDKLDRGILVHQQNMAHMSTVMELMARMLYRLEMCDEMEKYKADLTEAKQTLAETEQALAEAHDYAVMCGNLALNKTAFVKRHHNDNALAGLAVDGIADPDRFKTFSCAVCATVNQAWWAVDLGTKTHVGRIRLLARIETAYADQLSNFQIGVSDVSPEEQEPTLYNYTVCAIQEEPLPSGVFTDFQCGEKGRYVIVQRKDNNYLTICEAEIYRCM